MNVFARTLASLALFAVAAPLALASTLTGGVEVSGGASYDQNSMTFVQPFASNNDTGMFSSFAGGNVTYLLGTINYMSAVYQPLEAFTITNKAGDVLAFYTAHNGASQYLDSVTGALDVTLDETGFYTLNGGPEMAGDFDLTLLGSLPTGSGNNREAFDGNGTATYDPAAVTPEPASCFLLGTGLIGLAAFVNTRRRKPVAVTQTAS